MTIPFDPALISLGALTVRWFGVLALLGLALALWRTLRSLDGERLPRALALDALAWALPTGIVTARVVHVLGWWDYYFVHSGEIWQLGLSGLSLWGGLVGGGAMALARLRAGPKGRGHSRSQSQSQSQSQSESESQSQSKSERAARVLDAAAPNVALGIAIGRLGAFVDGFGQGLPTNLPWATEYASPLASTPDFGVPRHPAQLYDAIAAVVLWLVLERVPRGAAATPGARLIVFCLIYAGARLGLGAVRADPAFLFGLQIEQLLALVVLGWAGAWGGRLLLSVPRGKFAAAGGREQRPREDSMAA